MPNTVNATFDATPSLPYFEHAWSVLSIIGVFNVFLGLLIIGITSFSKLTVVPIVSSAAGAIANGLYFHAYYDKPYPLAKRAAAAAIGDTCWLVSQPTYPHHPLQVPEFLYLKLLTEAQIDTRSRVALL